MHMVALIFISGTGFHPWLIGDYSCKQGPQSFPRQMAAEVSITVEICTPKPQPSSGGRTCTHLPSNVVFGINGKQRDTHSE